jgi:hypothetical protein
VQSGLFSAEYQILQGVGKVSDKVRGVISVEALLRTLQLTGESQDASQSKQKNVS